MHTTSLLKSVLCAHVSQFKHNFKNISMDMTILALSFGINPCKIYILISNNVNFELVSTFLAWYLYRYANIMLPVSIYMRYILPAGGGGRGTQVSTG